MYRQHKIAVVIPMHNEARFIASTIQAIPDFVDLVVVVDDGSSDDSCTIVMQLAHKKLVLLKHQQNSGVGMATVNGYRMAAGRGVDIIAVMDGDGQMDAGDLPKLLDALIFNGLDYVKGNRFLHTSITNMPLIRYWGNRFFSLLMRYAMGIAQPLDAQSGYSAIRTAALSKLDLDLLYPRYGFLNTLLFQIVTLNLRMGSVPVHTLYGEEVSGINPFITVPTLCYIILRGYWGRLSATTTQDNYSAA